MDEEEKFDRIGQLVILIPDREVGTCISLWDQPATSVEVMGYPKHVITKNSYALVLDKCGESYKVFVNDFIGWIDGLKSVSKSC